MKIFVFFVAIIIVATWPCHGLDHGTYYQIFPLRTKTGLGGHYIPEVSCSSWRVGVEAHNLIDWKTVPIDCEGYIGNYMLGDQYRSDSKTVNEQAYIYAKTLNITAKDIWVFDIDETTLSNLPYYAHHGFGYVLFLVFAITGSNFFIIYFNYICIKVWFGPTACEEAWFVKHIRVQVFNATSFDEWVDIGKAPALPESLKLYKKLLSLGIKIAFLTGRPLDQKAITATNLKLAGYRKWEKLITKDGAKYHGKTAVRYKSAERKKLEESGYRIVGNIGDQWSDILGTNTGLRTFKLPDPMYYIS